MSADDSAPDVGPAGRPGRRRGRLASLLRGGRGEGSAAEQHAPAATPVVAPVHGALAGAIAGRRVEVVVGGHERAYADGQAIHLPPGVEGRRALALVAVQAALIAAGSLDERVLRRLVGRRRAASRYLTLEALRAVAVLEDVLPPWIVAEVRAVADLAPAEDPAGSLRRAHDDASVPEAPELLGVLRPSRVLRAGGGEIVEAPDAGGADPLAGEVLRTQLDEVEDEEEADESKILRLLESPIQQDNVVSRLMQELLNAGRSPDAGEADGGSEAPVGSMTTTDRIGEHGQLVDGPPEGLRDAPPPERPWMSVYPEWDHRRGTYRPDHCHVVEMDPAPADEEDRRRLEMPPDVALQRRLARLTMRVERHDRRGDGESLDLRALVDFGVARAAGVTPDERIYSTRARTGRDLGVVVLLDASGSTAEGTASGASVWDEQRRLAASLVEGLEAVGDRVAAYAFRSHGRHDVRFLRLKEFDARFGGAARRRLEDLEPSGFTRLGAAIRHGAHLARTGSGTSRTLLVVVSDGLPYEDGYDERHAEEDVARALAEAADDGVGCVCLSVGSAVDPEAVGRAWRDVSHLCMEEPRALAREVEPLFRTALQAALERSHGSVAAA